MPSEMRNLLSLSDLPGDELDRLLALAAEMKRDGPDAGRLAGKQVALLFLNPSLRTRTSMQLAAESLGANVVSLTPGDDAWTLETKPGAMMDGAEVEHLVDAVRVLSEMVDLVGVRAFAGLKDLEEDRSEPVLSMVARESTVPVVSMESALDHPLQALGDLLTLREEFGDDLTGVPVTLTWTPHPRQLPLAVGAAFVRATQRMGMALRIAAPPEFAMPGFLLDEARAAAAEGASITTFESQAEAVNGSKAVYAKAWAAPGLLGDWSAARLAQDAYASWTVDDELMSQSDDGIFLHSLPVRRNVVVTDSVLDGPKSAVVRQAGNRLHTARAALATLLGKGA